MQIGSNCSFRKSAMRFSVTAKSSRLRSPTKHVLVNMSRLVGDVVCSGVDPTWTRLLKIVTTSLGRGMISSAFITSSMSVRRAIGQCDMRTYENRENLSINLKSCELFILYVHGGEMHHHHRNNNYFIERVQRLLDGYKPLNSKSAASAFVRNNMFMCPPFASGTCIWEKFQCEFWTIAATRVSIACVLFRRGCKSEQSAARALSEIYSYRLDHCHLNTTRNFPPFPIQPLPTAWLSVHSAQSSPVKQTLGWYNLVLSHGRAQ